MELDDVTRGDEMTRGQDDQGMKWPGTKWKGTNRRVTAADRVYFMVDLMFMVIGKVVIWGVTDEDSRFFFGLTGGVVKYNLVSRFVPAAN
jgi:hypothetical protein